MVQPGNLTAPTVCHRIAWLACLALAALLALAPISSAHADGCNLDDLSNAFWNTLTAVASPDCASADANTELWIAVLGISGTIAEMDSAPGDPGSQFCQQVKNVLSGDQDAIAAAKDVKKWAADCNCVSAETLKSLNDALDSAVSAASSVADIVSVVSCGCTMEKSLSQDFKDLGDCIKDALCGVGSLIGQPCSCTPSPPVPADCTPSIVCSWADNATVMCQNAIYGNNQNTQWPPIQEVSGPNGTLIIQPGTGNDGAGHCAPDHVCFCPKPLTVVPIWDQAFGAYLYRCECPNGAQPAGDTGPDALKCMCPNGQQMQPDGSCAPACSCKNNQIAQNPSSPDQFCQCTCREGQVLAGDYCVTPCQDPTKVLTSSGACCDPNHVNSCGECCPEGETPDPQTMECRRTIVPLSVPPKLPKPL